jgi:hypothetical protein
LIRQLFKPLRQALAGVLTGWLAAMGLLVGFVYWHYRDLNQEFRSDMRRLDEKIDPAQVVLGSSRTE